MRTVYNFGPAVFEETHLAVGVSHLPEAASVAVTFRRPSERFLGGTTHLVDAVTIEFLNGRVATVEGYFLWKFRDSIPPAFGDDTAGFLDTNPFGPGPVEALYARIQRFHDTLFRRQDRDDVQPPPVRVEVDCLDGIYRIIPPAVLSPEIAKQIGGALIAAFPRVLPDIDDFLASVLRVMADKGRLHYEPRPSQEHPGMLRNTQVFTPWPASALQAPVEDLLPELCHLDSDHGPTPTLFEHVMSGIKPHADATMRELANSPDAFGRRLRKELGLTGGGRRKRASPEEVLAALAMSTTPTLAEDVMFAEWRRSRGKVPFADYVA